jgi:two-component system, LytTR family, sensor kinase
VMNLSAVSRRRIVILLHVGFWVLLFMLPYFFRQPYQNNKVPVHFVADERLEIHNGISFLTWIALFYLNVFFLLPRYYFKKYYGQYFAALGVLLLILSFINWASFHLLVPEIPFFVPMFLLRYLFPCLFFIATSTAYAMFVDRVRTDRLTAARETETLKTELAFLRSQVSPHFLFNVLNNMVALARKGSDQLEPSLIKLSSLLRYMLYETAEEKVPLEKEVTYLKSYVDLQTQRFRKTIPVHVVLKEPDAPYEIEPMLLIPFVENAFKHGVTLEPDAAIEIELGASKGMLQLLVRNKYNCEDNGPKDKSSGIGLTNVARRLNLLYKDHHSLLINKKDGWYMVSLQLNLH